MVMILSLAVLLLLVLLDPGEEEAARLAPVKIRPVDDTRTRRA